MTVLDLSIAIAALVSIPSVVTFGQAFVITGVLSSVSLLGSAWLAYMHRKTKDLIAYLIVQAAFAYWYLIPIVQTALSREVRLVNHELHDCSPAELLLGAVAVFVTKAIATGVYYAISNKRLGIVEKYTGMLRRRRIWLPVLIILGELGLGLVPFFASDRPFFVAILSSRSLEGIFPRYVKGTSETLLYNLTFFLISCCLVGLERSLFAKNMGRSVMLKSIALTAAAIYTIAIGTRTVILAMTMPFLTAYVLIGRTITTKMKVAVVLVGIWWVTGVIVETRQTGLLAGSAVIDHVGPGNLADNNFFGELIYSMQIVPEQLPFSFESPLLRVATGWIPRSVWPDKPDFVNGEIVMRMRLHQPSGELEGNILPGIIGQYWQVGGWIGIFAIGVWIALFTRIADKAISQSDWTGKYIVLAFVWSGFTAFRGLATSLFFGPSLCLLTLVAFGSQRDLQSGRFATRMVASLPAPGDRGDGGSKLCVSD